MKKLAKKIRISRRKKGEKVGSEEALKIAREVIRQLVERTARVSAEKLEKQMLERGLILHKLASEEQIQEIFDIEDDIKLLKQDLHSEVEKKDVSSLSYKQRNFIEMDLKKPGMRRVKLCYTCHSLLPTITKSGFLQIASAKSNETDVFYDDDDMD